MRSPAGVIVHASSFVATAIAITAGAAAIFAQARSAPDWTTQGSDAQRTSWMRVDPFISLDNMAKFQFLWKLKVDNESRHGNALTAPVALGNLMTFRGFKSLIFVGGSSNNVYGSTTTSARCSGERITTTRPGAREYAGSPICPGGMTLPLTRATRADAADAARVFRICARAPSGEGGRRRTRERGAAARGDRGAHRRARQSRRRRQRHACRRGWRRYGGRPRDPPPARGADPAKPDVAGRGPNFVFSVAADGLLRGIIPDTGDLALAPAQIPARKRHGDGIDLDRRVRLRRDLEHVRRRADGGIRHGLHGRDETGDDLGFRRRGHCRALRSAPTARFTPQPAAGSSEHANAIVALEGRTLK